MVSRVRYLSILGSILGFPFLGNRPLGCRKLQNTSSTGGVTTVALKAEGLALEFKVSMWSFAFSVGSVEVGI